MSNSSVNGQLLKRMFDALLAAYGSQGWWPGESPTEIVIGAILTQNTNWKNVEKAIARLKAANLLDWAALRDVPIRRLAACIRPAGYFRIKARRLKNFVSWLWDEHGGSLDSLAGISTRRLRKRLLAVSGIGRETADAILLYALGRPTFVVDAYTARVARRHKLVDASADYEALKSRFEEHLPRRKALFNEYHALLVEVGKRHCRRQAQCEGCPLERFEHDPEA